MSSASSLETASFNVLGAPSTISLASFNPNPVNSLTTLITLILLAPALANTTSNSVFSSAPAAAPAPHGVQSRPALPCENAPASVCGARRGCWSCLFSLSRMMPFACILFVPQKKISQYLRHLHAAPAYLTKNLFAPFCRQVPIFPAFPRHMARAHQQLRFRERRLIIQLCPTRMRRVAAKEGAFHPHPPGIADFPGKLRVFPGVGGFILPQHSLFRHPRMQKHIPHIGPFRCIFSVISRSVFLRHTRKFSQCDAVFSRWHNQRRVPCMVKLRRSKHMPRMHVSRNENDVRPLRRILRKNEFIYRPHIGHGGSLFCAHQ